MNIHVKVSQFLFLPLLGVTIDGGGAYLAVDILLM